MKRTIGLGAIVVLAVALATGLTAASFALGVELSFEWYLAAIVAVAWRCGRTPAIVATVLSAVVADFLFLPVGTLSFGITLTDAARLVVFLGIALLVAHLVAARDRAEEERRRRERLLAMVAHELGNMTFALRTWTAALGNQRVPGEHLDSAARALGGTVDAIAKLVRDLLDWSRIALGKIEVQPIDVDLAEIVGDALDEVRAEAAGIGVTLSSSFVRAPVHADRERVHQVALNLLTNALKATQAGGEIVVCVQPERHGARFSVRDTGRGIPPEMLRALSELGRIRSDGRGLGLGLALSRDLVRAQDGSLTVESAGPGTGVMCTVHLPAAHGEPAPRADGRRAAGA